MSVQPAAGGLTLGTEGQYQTAMNKQGYRNQVFFICGGFLDISHHDSVRIAEKLATGLAEILAAIDSEDGTPTVTGPHDENIESLSTVKGAR